MYRYRRSNLFLSIFLINYLLYKINHAVLDSVVEIELNYIHAVHTNVRYPVPNESLITCTVHWVHMFRERQIKNSKIVGSQKTRGNFSAAR
jgi:hypothetical protein